VPSPLANEPVNPAVIGVGVLLLVALFGASFYFVVVWPKQSLLDYRRRFEALVSRDRFSTADEALLRKGGDDDEAAGGAANDRSAYSAGGGGASMLGSTDGEEMAELLPGASAHTTASRVGGATGSPGRGRVPNFRAIRAAREQRDAEMAQRLRALHDAALLEEQDL
jgi:hypothetical protein